MKCLSKGCKTISLLMTCELCYPCSQLIEHGKQENDVSKVTRLEVIDENGRSYTKHHISNVKFSLQDDGKTLKIFLEVQDNGIK